MNRIISARRLDPLIWAKIVEVLLDTQRLRKGFMESLDQHQKTHARQWAHLVTLRERVEKLEKRRQDLPALADLETLEVLAKQIREWHNCNLEPCPQDKRQILEMLHVRVLIGLDEKVSVTGWFDQGAVSES